jgi:pimeloyl-ACP methyl ester carboxylesterase
MQTTTRSTKTIVFVHGMYLTGAYWSGWAAYFSKLGYTCHAINWPRREAPIAKQWARHPDPELHTIGLTQVTTHVAQFVKNLPERPILIGHSMGGLIVQLLRQQALAAAAMVINSAPSQGLLSLRWSFLRANWAHLNPFVPPKKPVTLGFRNFQYAFANGLPENIQRAAFEHDIVPESRRIAPDALGKAGQVDYAKPGCPLLFIAGSHDHIIPPSLNKANFRRYAKHATNISFREFPDRRHLIISQPGWEEVAEFCQNWLSQIKA